MNLLNKDLQNITLRNEQDDCLDFVFDKLQTDTIKKFFLLDLPTGVGKSILCLSIIKRYLKEINPSAKFDVLTESKILQRQYSEEFNSISNLWGRNTYQCKQFSCSCEQGKEFSKITKLKCEECPYDLDKESFMQNKISLTNFHMYILMRMNGMLKQRESNVLIVDEAHDLETVLSDFITITLSHQNLTKMKFDNVNKIISSFKSITSIDDFVDHCREVLIDEVRGQMGALETKLKSDKKSINRDLSIDALLNQQSSQVDISRAIENLKNLETRIDNFLIEYEKDNSNWILQTEYDEKKRKKLVIQPVWAYPYFKKYIWDHYDKIILMSGSIINKKMFSYLNGIPEKISEYYSIDSPFEARKRPIYYFPVGKMNYANKEKVFKDQLPLIKKLLEKYKNQKGIIHTVNFELSNWLKENIKDDRLIFHTSDQKSKKYALKKHFTSSKPTVLVSPSMNTGLDLKDKRARFQILLKIPYPHLGNLKNKSRMKMNSEWYKWMTVVKLIQTYGRAVRNKNDHADFIILDSCFGDVLKFSYYLIPNWIQKAIKQVNL